MSIDRNLESSMGKVPTSSELAAERRIWGAEPVEQSAGDPFDETDWYEEESE